MRPKSGLPKRRALRATPQFRSGFRDNPAVAQLRSRLRQSEHKVSAVSLFCGCGGMDLGFEGGFSYRGDVFPSLPFKIEHAYDINEDAVRTYRLNLGLAAGVADLTKSDSGELPAADVVLGGFPCQDFSSCGPKTGLKGSRGLLYKILENYMRVHQPIIAVGENVPHLARLAEGGYLDTIVRDFESAGYNWSVWRLYCPNYGLPQNRLRLFFVSVRNDIFRLHGRPSEPEPSHFMDHRSIDWAIDDLMAVSDETVPNQSQYFVATKATAGAGQGDQVSRRGEVSYAVRANPKARVHFHYELPRRLTVRECARLQAFPDEFVFPFSASVNMMQIGNAVPPIIGHAVASELSTFIQTTRHPAGTAEPAATVQRKCKGEHRPWILPFSTKSTSPSC
jgi:DNA (cytosine-5)-methyltransferase 1